LFDDNEFAADLSEPAVRQSTRKRGKLPARPHPGAHWSEKRVAEDVRRPLAPQELRKAYEKELKAVHDALMAKAQIAKAMAH